MDSIAIVSVGALLPGADSFEAFGEVVARGLDATREVPASRWVLPPKDAMATEAARPDRVRSTRAGVLDDAAWQAPLPGFDLLPHERAALDPSVQVLLVAAAQAWSALGDVDRRRTAVVLGNIVLPTDGANALSQWTVGQALQRRLGLRPRPQPAPSVWNRWVAGLPAGILARTLGLGGDAFTLDAACASSLFAVQIAVDKLLRREADVVLTGGLSRPSGLYTQMGFSQLGALSPSGRCSPFDARGDGLVVGEGAAVLALQRLEDAHRAGHRIHAVIRGVGLSNDVDGRLLAPSTEGQLRAMRSAYAQAGWTPADVELLECHATGTPVGDAVEFESIRQLRAGASEHASETFLGASKANVGHLLTGAGAVAMLRALHGLGTGVIPPIANLEQPHHRLPLAGSGLVLPTEAVPWPRTGRPPRAAVSGFGFGGTNAHVLLEHPDGADIGSKRRVFVPAEQGDTKVSVAIVGLGAHVGPWASVQDLRERLFDDDNPDRPQHKACFGDLEGPPGWFIDALDVPVGQFRIPPHELAALLPQQVLLLRTAVDAMDDRICKSDGPTGSRCGVFAGVELDFGTTDFHLRWVVRARASRWAQDLGRPGEGPDFERWVDGLCDALGPALSADRTMGGLASVAASRVARELEFGGPSFTLSSEENSGMTALSVATRALQAGELDLALVGAVGMTGDVRAWLAAAAAHGDDGTASASAEGSVSMVLMRTEDAIAAGERIYAIVEGLGAASGPSDDPADNFSSVSPRPSRTAAERSLKRALGESGSGTTSVLDLGTARFEGAASACRGFAALHVRTSDRLGDAGPVSGLLSVLASALRLHHQVLDAPQPGSLLGGPGALGAIGGLLTGAQRWVHDRASGPRTVAVCSCASMGHTAHAILAEYEPHARPWTPPLREGLFFVTGANRDALCAGLVRLAEVAEDLPEDPATAPIHTLARGWFMEHCKGGASLQDAELVVALVASEGAELGVRCRALAADLKRPGPVPPRAPGRVMFTEAPLGRAGELAFVFPGSGSQFVGMGRRLLLAFPEVVAEQARSGERLRQQLQADLCWNTDAQTQNADARGLILAQVTLGTLGSDVLRHLGVRPQAVLGYSLGETAGLFSLGAWSDREGMLQRVADSPLFATELTGEARAVARRWALPEGTPVDWTLGVVDADAAAVDAALSGEERAYRLIVNTPSACVIGGDRTAVERTTERLGTTFRPIDGVTTVHCDVVREVEADYRALHVQPTEAPDDVRFYSGAWGRSYRVTAETAADSVTAQAVDGLDYPAVVHQAWNDGVRLFVELGPGASCTRMIDTILGGAEATRPFFARSISSPSHHGREAVLRVLGWLVAHRVPVETRALARVFEPDPFERCAPSSIRQGVRRDGPTVHLDVGRPALGPLPSLPPSTAAPTRAPSSAAPPQSHRPRPSGAASDQPRPANRVACPPKPMSSASPPPWYTPLAATADAHAAFLAAQQQVVAAATALLRSRQGQDTHPRPPRPSEAPSPQALAPAPAPLRTVRWTDTAPPRSLDRDACVRFAVGQIGDVLGPTYAAFDAHPTRVRLPAEPLMLVDRILDIVGEPHSMSHGRVVTEHDVHAQRWYLDGGRIPTCVAVEAGQADLFLSAFLGIDGHTKGHAVYRLLDATVTFHDRLPAPPSTIRYDIRIERFFRQGQTWLFRFGFDASVNGVPLMTMRDGIAGFFTEAELAAGKGVVEGGLSGARPSTALEVRPTFAPAVTRTLDAAQLDALRAGDVARAFGPEFATLGVARPRTLPGAPMNLVHRITKLDPGGGEFGLGVVEGEADIAPDDWFIICHFSDDPVMPGTLMYECCMHTLRVFLLSLGWVGDETCTFEPRLGVQSRLKCRGQVLESTQVVRYRVTMRQFGADSEPWVICDATMFADGKRIVDIEDMSCQLRGTSAQALDAMWRSRGASVPTPAVPNPEVPKPVVSNPNVSGPTYDKATLVAYAYGKPSEAFGAPYAIFDNAAQGGRKIARLPGAPFQFIDRVTAVNGRPFVCEAGCDCVAEVDRDTWAWTLEANGQEEMAFAVLLEIGLQACGWLAAYAGSALTSDIDLKFRNLGGEATLHRTIAGTDACAQTLVMRATMTAVSQSGGMIIQHFDFGVYTSGGQAVYEGTTYFGFFTAAALSDQKGLRDVVPHVLAADERARSRAPMQVPRTAPMPTERWRMIDRVDLWVEGAGNHGQGFLEGSIDVDPSLWFFEAHFHEDPVWPGSLGLEAFLQLLKVYAIDRFELGADATFRTMPVGHTHAWEYRGQVIPAAAVVTVQAHIVAVDAAARRVEAEGILIVDGRPIYAMKRFALEVS